MDEGTGGPRLTPNLPVSPQLCLQPFDNFGEECSAYKIFDPIGDGERLHEGLV